MNVSREPSVLFVLDGLYPTDSEGGGAENQVRVLAAEMRRRGLPVQIVVPMVSFGEQERNLIVDGTPVTRIRFPKIPLLGSLCLYAGLIWYLFRHRRSYDVIHAHIAHRFSAVACMTASILNKPILVKLTGWLEMSSGILSPQVSTSAGGRWLQRQFRKASYLQAISHELASRLQQRGYPTEQIKQVPNAVNTQKFSAVSSIAERQALRVQLGLRSGLIGIFVGRLVPEKSLPTLIHAWKEAFDATDALLVLVGDGPQRADLTRLCAELDMTGKVRFLGGRKDVPELLRAADLGLLPSTHEGLSNTLLEYMACGLPVIGSRISGTEDLVRDRHNGRLFEAGNVSELADALAWFAGRDADQRLTLGQAARSTVVDYASIGTVVDRLVGLYRDAPPAGNGPARE